MKTIDDFSLFIIIQGMKTNRYITFISRYCLLASMVMGLSGCAGEVFETVDDYRTVVTVRIDGRTFNLQSVKTYQLIPDVLDLSEPSARRVVVDHARDEAILDELSIQLENANLQNIEDVPDLPTGEAPSPDVIIFASLVAQGAWDYNGPVAFSELGNQIVYYSGAPADMSYDVESVIITMFNPDLAVADHPAWAPALWTAGIHNAYSDMTENTVRTGIATAFEQSPYISQTAATGGVQ